MWILEEKNLNKSCKAVNHTQNEFWRNHFCKFFIAKKKKFLRNDHYSHINCLLQKFLLLYFYKETLIISDKMLFSKLKAVNLVLGKIGFISGTNNQYQCFFLIWDRSKNH